MEGGETKSKFTWKILNFSELTVQKLYSYSDTFIAGGCKWRLLLFPKGNNVDDLSIYLDVADSTKLPLGWSRDAELSLSLISQSNNNSLVRKASRHLFSAKESNWGYRSFIPLCKIEDAAERYLVDDTLTIEAEVHVVRVVHPSELVEYGEKVIKLKRKASELAVEPPPNQTPLIQKPVVDIVERVVAPTVTDTPITTEPLNEIKGASEILSNDPASEPVKTSADVQTVCKGLITELSSRKKRRNSVSSKEISVPSQTSSPEIQQQQKEALQGFFNMSLEALQQANSFVNIEGILHTLVQHTDNLQEKTILEDILSRLAEFKESIPDAKAVVETAQARKESLAGKTAELDSKLERRQKELSSLESEFSILSEEEAKLEAEIQRLMRQKEKVVTQKNSVSLDLERANEETSKDIEEWRNLEGEMKKANGEWLVGKEKLASANVRWKLLRENLGLGKLNIS